MEMRIGANIKRLRTAKNITQEQLSAAMNVTCAAVSKWERGETFPDITLLQPLAYFFGVTLDELMGYDEEKIQADIKDVIALYRQHWLSDYAKAREIIIKAYHDYPNDYFIMHYYMWNIGGDMADNDPAVLIAHKDEFLAICDKIQAGCTDENLRHGAWNMRAKILHAEGKTDEALEIYRTKFPIGSLHGDRKRSSCLQRIPTNTTFMYRRICMSLRILRLINSAEPSFLIRTVPCRKRPIMPCTAGSCF